MKELIYIFLGGGTGSVLRYYVQELLHERIIPYSFPRATFTVNIFGSFFFRMYSMNVRDIVYFLVEIEERYGVVFDKEKINNPDFFTLKNISNELLAKRELKNC